jgi:hypothetical protein
MSSMRGKLLRQMQWLTEGHGRQRFMERGSHDDRR